MLKYPRFIFLVTFLIISIVTLVLALPLTRQKQDTRRRAAEPTTSTIADNFDSNAIDENTWIKFSSSEDTSPKLDNNKISVEFDGIDQYKAAGLRTRQTIQGDFSAEITVSDYSVTNIGTKSANTPLCFDNTNNNYFCLRPWTNAGGTKVILQGKDRGETAGLDVNNLSSFKLKLSLTGSTAQGFVDRGNGYESVGQLDNAYTEEGWIAFMGETGEMGPNSHLKASFDDFSLTFTPQVTIQSIESIEPPANLTATCAYSGREVTVTWDPVANAETYLFRLNDPRNDTQSCGDGWWCADPPDKTIDITTNSYIHTGTTPNQNYRTWVHAHLAESSINSEGTAIDFTCPAPITGDINLDKIVDISDYSILVNQITKLDTSLTADLNQDSQVDMTDYSLIITNFGQTRP
jgi:type II secretory pathway pseudopilin PulG